MEDLGRNKSILEAKDYIRAGYLEAWIIAAWKKMIPETSCHSPLWHNGDTNVPMPLSFTALLTEPGLLVLDGELGASG